MTEELLIPNKLDKYYKFGNYNDVEKIIQSRIFAPTFITGLARSGKTVMVEQACAYNNRECIRVNITEESDEDDLIGGFRMHDGNTVWFNGPVVEAMLIGAILLLDEVDKASFKCMCLQPVLEGSPIYLKKTGVLIQPAEGFNVMATANTKGQGDLRGKFLSSQLLDEAFLDRFSITIEHGYPPADIETNIAKSYLPPDGKMVTSIDAQFIDHLIDWAGRIRQSYCDKDGSEIISTGRVIHIMKSYRVFKCPFKAVKLGVSRFDENTRDAFWEMFKSKFPYEEGDLSPAGSLNSRKFIKKVAESMDLSEFNVRYKIPQTKTP